jgi:type III pantothenate kinase
MNQEGPLPLVAVDVGNSQIVTGLFSGCAPQGELLPQPQRTFSLDTDRWEPVEIALWLAPHQPAEVFWLLASVQEDVLRRLQTWLANEGSQVRSLQLLHDQLPLKVELQSPAEVGIDRLLGAVAVNHIRPVGRPAVVIDIGSAITVDLVSPEGTFCGGAILPGMRMSAKALHQYTDKLPEVPIAQLQRPPSPLGRSTDEAISSGLYWGAVGAIRTLVEQLRIEMEQEPMIVLTGGGAVAVAGALDSTIRYEPHLILSGIALAGRQ